MVKHVAIIGAGAAGMSAAEALSALCKVTVIERTNTCGGMATSEKIDSAKFGASYINDGVQGCSPQFANTFAVFDTILGFKPADINLQVSFGRDIDEDFWSNVFPSNVIDKYTADIRKFGRVLKVIKSVEPVFGLIPVDVMLSMFRFSPVCQVLLPLSASNSLQGFGDVIVYPLVALFMPARLISLQFEFSPESFLASIPPMKAFPRLSEVYTTWKNRLQAKGVEFLLETQAISVLRRRDGVTLSVQSVKNSNTLHENETLGEIRQLQFDEMILACDANTALKILGTEATFMEKRVLGNVKVRKSTIVDTYLYANDDQYLYDVSVTHCDRDYMEKYYQLDFKEELFSSERKDNPKELEKMDYAKKNFKPLYFIRSYPADKRKIEMSFDLYGAFRFPALSIAHLMQH
ncbi:9379_t:CDS:2 [Acaulospora colombiana]|uniref:9379_t:CDS:1 n=1 Tax=Acaulospora colombiana TaxID=27376 RepID=A0ACA9NTI1_9GLOM|nr:9379_t:CDS:2 [Acaulospora colombiana]